MSAALAVALSALPHDANLLGSLLDNGPLWWGLAACGLAQLSKLAIEVVLHRRWRPAVLFETGGMPSSHSALLTGTAAAIGWQQGFADPLFALAAAMCFVVLYDAAGVRRAAGLTARRVNGLPDGLWQAPAEAPPATQQPAAALGDPFAAGAEAQAAPEPLLSPLKENLGHTRLEVLIGSLLGPAIALPGLVLVGTPLELAQHWGLLPIG
ncbi:divergent PAP2 family protein [Vulcanococcus limneticus]|uniref:divergent PAP2 family protein n=1 Tax=Vulcanococcus limneticus TaxID=2170428 RepID=UPI000B98B054|nr:divergent PAP2 family protein [Vulcanococcus limneticus]MCP9790706.1 divergent PAP2 family protein [Vulcanococcus limneticus MW73D5]MCP9892951.1 divergent PAP2 family protein [Vulcanococcus limneticus Candia 3F8]MCP9896314.1 divergent PAP2 family protein [Vulcanococcus limneticus Candia 3B3]